MVKFPVSTTLSCVLLVDPTVGELPTQSSDSTTHAQGLAESKPRFRQTLVLQNKITPFMDSFDLPTDGSASLKESFFAMLHQYLVLMGVQPKRLHFGRGSQGPLQQQQPKQCCLGGVFARMVVPTMGSSQSDQEPVGHQHASAANADESCGRQTSSV